MAWYRNLRIVAKLMIGFLLVACTTAAVGYIGITNVKEVDRSAGAMYNYMAVPITQVGDIAVTFQRIRVNSRDVLLATTPQERQNKINRIAELTKEIEKHNSQFEKTILSPAMKQGYDDYRKKLQAYLAVVDQSVNFAKAGQTVEAKGVLDNGAKVAADMQTAIDKMIDMKTDDAKKAAEINAATAASATTTMLMVIAGAVLLSMLLGWMIARMFSTQIAKVTSAAQKLASGDVNITVNAETTDEIGQLQQSFGVLINNIRNAAAVAERISAGDLKVDVKIQSDQDVLGLSLKKCVENINALVADANMLAQAAVEGRLATRADAAKHQGDFRRIVEGVNNTLDSVIGPLNVAANYVDRISKGDIPPKITDNYNGDFNVIKNNLNDCIEKINALVADANMLAQAAVDGKLATRADAAKHQGDFRRIVEGVNSTLDSVIGPLNVAANYVDRISKGDIPPKITDSYNGDFNVIKNNLNACVDNVNAVVADANMLVQAAVEGRLSTRADASKHQGDFRKIVEGVNTTLDAVIEPIQEAAAVLSQMAQGNLQMRVTGQYRGDHADIKNALNDTLDALAAYVGEIAEVLGEMANSNLDLAINNEYKGDFARIKDALNLIISSFNEVFTEINNAADQVASGSRQVSDGSQALSQGATEQAASVEELTASIGQVADQTKDNAINANQANELAMTAKSNAETGNQHMQEMLRSMEAINESSANISKIIKVIDEIAFQTNILALNAAVEAARAGQHGKGFAVVAEEVRNLAARSANAAKETTALIEGSIQKVSEGTRIATGTAQSLEQIVTGVSKAANLVGDIAAASNEQASAIAQINKGVEQVSQVVQTNSATAEESAAASEELSSQSMLLKEMIARFRLKSGNSGMARNQSRELTQSSYRSARPAETSTRGKPRIALTDREFGKY